MKNNDQQQSNRQETNRLTGDEPIEVILPIVVRLYAEYGSMGKNLFSAETEKALQPEIETLGAYSMHLLQNPAKMLSAAIKPAQIEEMRQRALKLYDMILESLAAASR